VPNMKNQTRRQFIKSTAAGTASVMLGNLACRTEKARKPNIIYILADDLGYNELGCYGQKKIRTPNIDRLASEGMRFTQHYSGSPVCAPSRCTLLTGKHTGHAYVRNNDEMKEKGDVWNDPSIEGQRPLPPGTVTMGTLLQEAGYKTACVGKWGLGGPDDSGHPNQQGFDLFYGYICQRQAHNYYPTHLWKNGEKDMLEGNTYFSPHQKLPEDKDPNDPASYETYSTKHYAADRMIEEALTFIQGNKDKPFFLYFATPVPHLALQVPDDSLEEYRDAFPETPYIGDRGYTPHRTPRAAYAAMITRMDRDIGRIMSLLKKLGLDENTVILFSSDNGATYTGGVDYEYFDSVGPLNGLKGSLYEGGIRVPMIARWPGKIKPGTENDHISAFWDIMPTLCDVSGVPCPEDTDGISLLPHLLNRGKRREHPYLYWEFSGYGGQQAIRMGDWKGIRRDMHKGNRKIQLYNLKQDIGEKNDLSLRYPDRVKQMEKTMQEARTPSEFDKWNFIDKKKE
jgi:arylsulfatase A-like enzyme